LDETLKAKLSVRLGASGANQSVGTSTSSNKSRLKFNPSTGGFE
jgi:hypothetical protein